MTHNQHRFFFEMAHEVFTKMIWTPLRSVVIPLLQKGWQAQPDGVVGFHTNPTLFSATRSTSWFNKKPNRYHHF